MDLIAIIVIVAMVAFVLSVATFALAIRRAGAVDSAPPPAPAPAAAASEFFTDDPNADPTVPGGRAAAVPGDVLVRHIERHIRLEQAAAEAFLERPTPESLHTRTTSPLLKSPDTRWPTSTPSS